MENVVITHAYQRFTIGVADPETADLLEIGLGEPTADCQLIVVDDKDVAIYVADIHYLKNCFVLRSDLLKHSPPHRKARAIAAGATVEPRPLVEPDPAES
jgi:GntR family transcriptional regulator